MDNRKSTPVLSRRGSALLLVLVVTVLLSVIGILFVMVTRLRDITSSNVADSRDLDGGVEAVVGQINKTLKDDVLLAIGGTELHDSAASDAWLAGLEPDWFNDNGTPANPADDGYRWSRITDLFGDNFGVNPSQYYDPNDDADSTEWDGSKPEFEVRATNVLVKVIPESDRVHVVRQNAPDWSKANLWYAGARADADGDGVADSRWIEVPNLTSSKGQPVYAAVRIIDNCAMLNLNTAYCFYQTPFNAATPVSPFAKTWYINQTAQGMGIPYNGAYYTGGGRYLAEINYLSFLRGSDLNNTFWGPNTGDDWYNIFAAKKFGIVNVSGQLTSQLSVDQVHDNVLAKIENPGVMYSLFDIGDELELRNRFLLTSKAESRIERKDAANYTLDSGGGVYAALEIPRDNSGNYDISDWKVRMDPGNFDLWDKDGVAKATASPDYNNSYKYDRRHICTFYSFDRNLRSSSYVLIDAAMKTAAIAALPEAQKEVIDAIFRPKENRPINLRWITDPANPDNITQNTLEARRSILHLLYAFMEYYCDSDLMGGVPKSDALPIAAKKSVQIVANLIDSLDDNNPATQGPFYNGSFAAANGTILNYLAQRNPNPTVINRSIIRDMIREISIAENQKDSAVPIIDIGATIKTPLDPFEFGLGYNDTPATLADQLEAVYGYEQQPFISELYVRVTDTGTVDRFAIELVSPYQDVIDLSGWNLVIEDQLGNPLEQFPTPLATMIAAGSTTSPARLVLRSNSDIPISGASLTANAFGTTIKGVSAYRLCLKRTDPLIGTSVLTVDRIDLSKIKSLLTDTAGDSLPTHHVFKREDTAWKFCDADPNSFDHQSNIPAVATDFPAILTLGLPNGVTTTTKGYPLPVANIVQPIYTLGDFQKIAFVGNQRTGAEPNTITEIIAASAGESEIRFDLVGDAFVDDAGMLGYFCTLNRDTEGSLPGRININTAPVYVIAAAIPPSLVMTAMNDPNHALAIARQIVANRPYKNLSDLAKLPVMQKYMSVAGLIVGDASIEHDFEERDWIFNRLSNIFTVRSDTFTAYILVRLGTDGPQRRMIAIFDRSNVWSDGDTPRLVALHPVPDPR